MPMMECKGEREKQSPNDEWWWWWWIRGGYKGTKGKRNLGRSPWFLFCYKTKPIQSGLIWSWLDHTQRCLMFTCKPYIGPD